MPGLLWTYQAGTYQANVYMILTTPTLWQRQAAADDG
jgi:hypothetical protein